MSRTVFVILFSLFCIGWLFVSRNHLDAVVFGNVIPIVALAFAVTCWTERVAVVAVAAGAIALFATSAKLLPNEIGFSVLVWSVAMVIFRWAICQYSNKFYILRKNRLTKA